MGIEGESDSMGESAYGRGSPSMEVMAMHVVVHHRITDPEKFASMDAAEIGAGGPPGTQVRQFLPSKDGSAAFCVWETGSTGALRDYLDPATAGVAENAYFEVDGEHAMGLPEAAAAGAQ
jgi:hypothetical protein